MVKLFVFCLSIKIKRNKLNWDLLFQSVKKKERIKIRIQDNGTFFSFDRCFLFFKAKQTPTDPTKMHAENKLQPIAMPAIAPPLKLDDANFDDVGPDNVDVGPDVGDCNQSKKELTLVNALWEC